MFQTRHITKLKAGGPLQFQMYNLDESGIVVSASEFTDSPSTHITHQTTSIASAREVSDHEAEVSEGPVARQHYPSHTGI